MNILGWSSRGTYPMTGIWCSGKYTYRRRFNGTYVWLVFLSRRHCVVHHILTIPALFQCWYHRIVGRQPQIGFRGTWICIRSWAPFLHNGLSFFSSSILCVCTDHSTHVPLNDWNFCGLYTFDWWIMTPHKELKDTLQLGQPCYQLWIMFVIVIDKEYLLTEDLSEDTTYRSLLIIPSI